MRHGSRTTTTPLEASAIVAICFGLLIWQSLHAVASGFQSSPFTDAGAYWLLALEIVLGSVALLVLYARGFAVESLYPTPTLRGALVGVALYGIAVLTAMVSEAPFASAATPQPIDSMVSDARLTMGAIVALAVVNGTFEEVFLLGFLTRGLRGYGLSVALGVALLVRVLYHLYQGPLGALSVLVVGLVFSLYYVKSNTLWPPVFAHILADIIPFVWA